MSEFKKENLENIKSMFEEKTGVTLPGSRRMHRTVKLALVLAAVIICLSITAFAGLQFSSLEGDDLALGGMYEGDGMVAITVENRSDKLLEFEETFYLRRWSGETVQVNMEAVRFENTSFAPGSAGVMRIDLSAACDIAALEQPLEGNDHYYFLFTNNSFAFGQDWMCSVDFCPVDESEPEPENLPESGIVQPSSSEGSRARIEESLRPYFENVSMDIMLRRQQAYEYIEAYTALLDGFDGEVVKSVSPCLPGNRLDISQPLLSVDVQGDQRTFNTWTGVDADYRLIATEGEYAYVVEAVLQNGEAVPMLFILSYEAADIREDAYAFIHGCLLTFAELEEYRVYEGEGKVSYEVSGIIFDEPAEYARAVLTQYSDAEPDENAVEEFAEMYGYYSQHLGELICYHPAE